MNQYVKGNLFMFYGKNEIAEVNCGQDTQFALQVKEGAQLSVDGCLGLDQITPYQDALGIRQGQEVHLDGVFHEDAGGSSFPINLKTGSSSSAK